MTRLKSNLFFQIIYQLFAIVIPLITAPYITRIFDPADEGVISYAYSFSYYFIILAMLGLNTYGNRTIAINRDDKEILSKTFLEIQSIHFILSIGSCLLFFGIVSNFSDNKVIFLISSIYLIASAFDISWFYFGLENVRNIVIKNFIIKIVTTILIFTLIKTSDDIYKYVFILTVGTLVGHLSLWMGIHKYISFYRISFKKILSHFKPLLILAIPIVAMNIYKYMDKMMLKWIADYTSVGLYENSEKITNVLMSVITAVGLVLLPYSSKLVKNQEIDLLKKNMKYSIFYIMPITILVVFGLAAIAIDLAPVYLGEKYSQCGPLILGLSFSLGFTCISNIVRSQYLMPLKKDKEYIISLFAGAIVNIIANLALIYSLGALGAVIGTILAEATVCIVQLLLIKKEISIVKPLLKSIPFLIISIIMFLGVWYLSKDFEPSWKSILLEILIGAVIYICLAILYELFIDSSYICDICIMLKFYNLYFVFKRINYMFIHRKKMRIHLNCLYMNYPNNITNNENYLDSLFGVNIIVVDSVSKMNNPIDIMAICNGGKSLDFDLLSYLVGLSSNEYQLYFNEYDLNNKNKRLVKKIINNLKRMRYKE